MDLRVTARHALRVTHRLAPPLASAGAAALFLSPVPRARVWSIEREALASADVRDVAVRGATGRGATVRAYHWGDGARPVLLVHGWQARASRWAPLAAALAARGLSPIAFDAPGHGDSPGRTTDVPQVAAVIDQIVQDTGPLTALVAHSFGALGATLALRQGVPAERFAALAPVSDPEHLLQTFSRQLDLHPRLTSAVRSRVERHLRKEDHTWRSLTVDRGPHDPQIPVLVVHDDEDPVVPIAHGQRMLAAHADAGELLVTRGLDHQRMLTAPEVVQAVADFAAA
ncbi:alpha/beta hydrolase [Cellulomonas cellasea]|uniref:alpha/beta hydrolase n=1 Tax=Cellulomonas cellasea TaxID=43670 RepID=UPI0025A368ED|nr:alpha/beta hydrolase [Cellulomonas cellasea]MDM8085997.1 alpha/beta hydrolase [Cellulomonas cellasea]